MFKLRAGISGVEKSRFKAWLVAKVYSQREDIGYVFLPVVKHVLIRFPL